MPSIAKYIFKTNKQVGFAFLVNSLTETIYFYYYMDRGISYPLTIINYIETIMTKRRIHILFKILSESLENIKISLFV